MASETAAEARRKAASTLDYYNLKLGPTLWNFIGGLGIEYTDNVNYQEKNRQADAVFLPEVNTKMLWPLSEKNVLNLAVDVGYLKYVQRSDLDEVFLMPGSELSLNMFVKDFVINLHDRVRTTGPTYQNPVLTGRGNYNRLENVVGTTVNWDLNKLILTLGYDHANYISLNNSLQQAEGQLEVIHARAGFALHKKSLLGVEAGASLVDYAEPGLRDGAQYGGGLFYEAQLSPYISIQSRLGYTVYAPEGGGSVGVTNQQEAIYAQLSFNHRLNKWLTYTLYGGRKFDAGLQWGLFAQNVEYYFAYWNAYWNVISNISLRTGLFYEDGSVSGSLTEDFYRVGTEVGVSRPITQKLTVSLGYRYYYRDSNLPLRDYRVNSIVLNCAYRF